MKTINDNSRIRSSEVEKYLDQGKDFINDDLIMEQLQRNTDPDPGKVRDIIAKAVSIQTLTPEETALLLNVQDPQLWDEMKQAGAVIKKKVYDNRIVTFAPLYISNLCVNNCIYCGLREANSFVHRRALTEDEVKKEVEILAGKIGHKRLIIVYGEHPSAGIDYMIRTIKAIYSVKIKTRQGWGSIRRINVNAPPLSINELQQLEKAGLGTYQVFQETYHHDTYKKVHKGPLKADYQWRLYAMHRAFEAGIDDVGIGALFGLFDWRFEVMGLVYHTWELEKKFGIGPHTISFPRLEPAFNTPFIQNLQYKVSDEDFKKIITVIRLAVPYTGMILTARESSQMRKELIPLGITQTDASSRIGVGSYSTDQEIQEADKQQFILGDIRSLDTVIRELAEMGYITSFCTAGYRCGRTGQKIMGLLRSGKEGEFCKLNAVLTFREWLDDFASDETKKAGEKIIQSELADIKKRFPDIYSRVMKKYEQIRSGERDLYF